MTSGFRIYSRSGLEDISYYTTLSDGYSFQIEMTSRSEKKNLTTQRLFYFERLLSDANYKKDHSHPNYNLSSVAKCPDWSTMQIRTFMFAIYQRSH